MVNSYSFEGIGFVRLEHSTRAKHIIISIKPDKRIRLAVPTRVHFSTALEFVHKKKDWIRKTWPKSNKGKPIKKS